jgi:phage repressor protein C with HTH and peptisase S24 domain
MYPAGMNIYDARVQAVQRLIDTRFAGNQTMFSNVTGISTSYLSRMLKGEGDKGRKRIGDDMAIRIETALDLEPGSLLHPQAPQRVEVSGYSDQGIEASPRDKVGEMTPLFQTHRSVDELDRGKNDSRRLVGKVALAVMDVRASMGHGAVQPSHDNVVMSIVCDETWLRRHATFSSPDQLALITGFGDSMFPTFEDGDPLLVDRAVTDIKLDAVYVLSLNDELFIKRVQRRLDGTIMMISDNEKYPPQHVTDMQRNRFSVLGRVVMVWNPRRI